jgi:hypothetical protein
MKNPFIPSVGASSFWINSYEFEFECSIENGRFGDGNGGLCDLLFL